MDGALAYVKEVEDAFLDQRVKFNRFLTIMNDFNAGRRDRADVVASVKELFRGHPNLIFGFNTFLPKACAITLTDKVEAPPQWTSDFSEAIDLVHKIKKRFQNKDHVYQSFLYILNMYRKEQMSRSEVCQKVAVLLNDQPDLLDEFTRFISKT